VVSDDGKILHDWISELFPLTRSLVGPGFDKSLEFLLGKVKNKGTLLEYPSGETFNGWTVPNSWELVRGQILDSHRNVIIDTKNSNLHVWSHSIPFSGRISRLELESHLLTLPENPKAIPYATTYYAANWGFSLTYQDYLKLKDEYYIIDLQTNLIPGNLKVYEIYLPGESKSEILFSTYLCHPSMANNELSGPVIWAALVNSLSAVNRNYSYRFVIGPETIGPACYLSTHLRDLQAHNLAAFNLTCVGDPNNWSLLQSLSGNSYSDKIAASALDSLGINYTKYSFLDRGSDERMYSSVKTGIQMVSVMRSKYHEYPEYHNSLDNLSFVTPQALQDSLHFYVNLIRLIENDGFYTAAQVGEPFLSKFLSFPSAGGRLTEESDTEISLAKDLLAFANNSTISELSNQILRPAFNLLPTLNLLVDNNLLDKRLFG